jgi:hypothetical protein
MSDRLQSHAPRRSCLAGPAGHPAPRDPRRHHRRVNLARASRTRSYRRPAADHRPPPGERVGSVTTDVAGDPPVALRLIGGRVRCERSGAPHRFVASASDRSASPSDEGRPSSLCWADVRRSCARASAGWRSIVWRIWATYRVHPVQASTCRSKQAAVPIVERVAEMQRHQLDGLGAADAAAGVNRLVRTHGGTRRGRCGSLCGRGQQHPLVDVGDPERVRSVGCRPALDVA